jgi:hypothetical protein
MVATSTVRRAVALTLLAVVTMTVWATGAPAAADVVGDGACAEVRAARFLPAEGVADTDGAVRVFALQMKQEVRHVETYATFEAKVRCLFEDLVRPELAPDRPNLVVYPEYAGLATLAVGSRGAPARAIAAGPTRGSPDTADEAPGVLQAFGSLAATYADELAYYRTVLAARQLTEDPEAAADPERSFALADPRRSILVAATDTLARAFLAPHAELARREGVYVVSSTPLPELRRSEDPADLAALTDPDLLAGGDVPDHVWVATDARVWNEVWVWAPVAGQTAFSRERFGPLPDDDPRANVIHVNRKAPITPIEEEFLALTEGDTSPANTGPFVLDGVPGLRFSIANSLPAFAWGTGPTETGEDLGEPVPDGQDPCETPAWWMRCLEARGTNVVLQTEANPAPWASYSDPNGNWQPLLWMNSSWRHVADPTVGFAYSVTPWLVGNLVDLPFDGQVSIKRRDNPRPGATRRFVGNAELVPDRDPGSAAPFAGDHDEFVVVAPWVLDEEPSLPVAEHRARLAARAEAMLAGAGGEHENNYLETAVWADLVPPDGDDPDPAGAQVDGTSRAGVSDGTHQGAHGGDDRGDDRAGAPTDSQDGRGVLPATGGGAAWVGLLAMLAAGALRTRSGPARTGA